MSYSLTCSQAILVVVFVADKVRQGLYDYVPTRAVAESLGFPAPTAAKILQGLARSGIVETREGARGGVRLARTPAEVTLLDVLDAIEQKRPLFRTHLHVRARGDRPTRAQQAIHDALEGAEVALREALGKTTVQDLLDQIPGRTEEED